VKCLHNAGQQQRQTMTAAIAAGQKEMGMGARKVMGLKPSDGSVTNEFRNKIR